MCCCFLSFRKPHYTTLHPGGPTPTIGVRGHWLPLCTASTLRTAEWQVSATGMECTSATSVGRGLIIIITRISKVKALGYRGVFTRRFAF